MIGAPPPERESNSGALKRFEKIDVWAFDLDNTLYPASSDLWRQIDQRMTAFIAGCLGLDAISANAIQKFYYDKYGATLLGLMIERAVNPNDFLNFVHDIDRSSLAPDPRLARAIAALPGQKFIFTNGSLRHAEKTLEALGLTSLFAGLFDIAASGYRPKPYIGAYEKFFVRFGIDPRTAAMFEDHAGNLLPAYRFGMATVLVSPEARRENLRHVEFLTDGLTGFIEGVLEIL